LYKYNYINKYRLTGNRLSGKFSLSSGNRLSGMTPTTLLSTIRFYIDCRAFFFLNSWRWNVFWSKFCNSAWFL